MKALSAVAVLILLTVAAGCTSTCDNAGVTVDGNGNIVVRGADGFISPNSSILRNVSDWPRPPQSDPHFSFSQDYTLTRDGAMYVLENTAAYPNVIYRVNLSTGTAAPVGPRGRKPGPLSATFAHSKQTFIAATSRYAYSVDQKHPVISRADLSATEPALNAFIAGPRTGLQSPIAVAASAGGSVCTLDSATLRVLCYASGIRGNVVPSRSIDLKRLLGYAQGWDVIFDRSGRIVVSGTSDPNGLTGFSIAVIDITGPVPHLVRVISGPNTSLIAPQLAVDDGRNILALQSRSPNGLFGPRELLVFGPNQRGNATPQFVRSLAGTVTNPFRIAVDQGSGDVAILGSDGTAIFKGAARRAAADWPAPVLLPYRGWSLAFADRAKLVVANRFGEVEKQDVSPSANAFRSSTNATLNLHDPKFIASDQTGNLFVASTDGVVTALPNRSTSSKTWQARSFRTVFGRNMDAFAPDSAGYFYLSSGSNDAIVALAPNGRQSTIEGPQTGLNDPQGLAVNRNGELFVANAGDRSILVFARGASGNTAPIARIAGSATQLLMPQALAIDATGRLYVFDGPRTTSLGGGRHYVRVYAANAVGDAAPLASYDVQTKCWTNAI